MNDSTPKWLKKIFSVGTISLIVAIIGVWISYKTLLVDTGGELSVKYSSVAETAFADNCTIAVNEKTLASVNDFLPQFSNESKYVLKDFFLRYNIQTSDCELSSTGFYDIAESRNASVFTLRDERLAPGATVPEPIADIVCSGPQFTLSYDVTASFSGSEPYRTNHSLNFIYIPIGTMSTDQWCESIADTHPSTKIIAMTSETAWRSLTQAATEEATAPTTAVSTPATDHSSDKKVENTTTTKQDTPAEKKTTTVTTTKKSGSNFSVGFIVAICILVFLGGIFGTEELIETIGTALEWRSFSWSRFVNTFYDNVWEGASRASGFKKFWVRYVWICTCILAPVLTLLMLFGFFLLIKEFFF